MFLYLISQDENNGYDTYDSAVVVASDTDEARKINPSGVREWSDKNDSWMFLYSDGTSRQDDDGAWVRPEMVKVKLLGEAEKEQEKGVVIASFNAG